MAKNLLSTMEQRTFVLNFKHFPTPYLNFSHLAWSSNTCRDICWQLTETIGSFCTPGVSTIRIVCSGYLKMFVATCTEMWLWKQILGPIRNWSRLHLYYLCMNLWSWAGTILCRERASIGIKNGGDEMKCCQYFVHLSSDCDRSGTRVLHLIRVCNFKFI